VVWLTEWLGALATDAAAAAPAPMLMAATAAAMATRIFVALV